MLLNSQDLETIIQSLDESIVQKKGLIVFYGTKGRNKSVADLQLNIIELENTKRKLKEAQVNSDTPYSINVNN